MKSAWGQTRTVLTNIAVSLTRFLHQRERTLREVHEKYWANPKITAKMLGFRPSHRETWEWTAVKSRKMPPPVDFHRLCAILLQNYCIRMTFNSRFWGNGSSATCNPSRRMDGVPFFSVEFVFNLCFLGRILKNC